MTFKNYEDHEDSVKSFVISERARGVVWKKIADALNERGILSLGGNRWDSAMLCAHSLRRNWVEAYGATGDVRSKGSYKARSSKGRVFPDGASDLKAIILELRSRKKTWKQVARELTKQGFVSPTGRPWTGGGICTVSLSKGWHKRSKTSFRTKARPASTSNLATPKAPQEVSVPQLPITSFSQSVLSRDELEKVWKSNLDFDVKVKVTKRMS